MENIFKTDESYKYGELRKYDENYDRITSIIEEEITNPNLRKNGGILFGTVGLYYPESLIYMKDVLTDSIVGYMGLTQNYGKGLYISQIAVRKENRRQGIATKLVKEAIKRAHELGINTVSADIARDNDVSKAFFSTFEFSNDDLIYGGDRYLLDTEYYVGKHQEEFTSGDDKASTY